MTISMVIDDDYHDDDDDDNNAITLLWRRKRNKKRNRKMDSDGVGNWENSLICVSYASLLRKPMLEFTDNVEGEIKGAEVTTTTTKGSWERDKSSP